MNMEVKQKFGCALHDTIFSKTNTHSCELPFKQSSSPAKDHSLQAPFTSIVSFSRWNCKLQGDWFSIQISICEHILCSSLFHMGLIVVDICWGLGLNGHGRKLYTRVHGRGQVDGWKLFGTFSTSCSATSSGTSCYTKTNSCWGEKQVSASLLEPTIFSSHPTLATRSCNTLPTFSQHASPCVNGHNPIMSTLLHVAASGMSIAGQVHVFVHILVRPKMECSAFWFCSFKLSHSCFKASTSTIGLAMG